MWDLPGPGLEPVSPALAGGFLTTAPPGKPLAHLFSTLHIKILSLLQDLTGNRPFSLGFFLWTDVVPTDRLLFLNSVSIFWSAPLTCACIILGLCFLSVS